MTKPYVTVRQRNVAGQNQASEVFTLKEAAAEVGLTPDSWRSWREKGLIPSGTLTSRADGKGRLRVFTRDEVEAARAAVERSGRATAKHTISREEAAEMLGLTIGQWDQLVHQGLVPRGCWAPPIPGGGHGGRRTLYSPEQIEQAREALAAKQSRKPMIDGERVIPLKEAAAMIGIPRKQWYIWERKGWMPEGRMVSTIGSGGRTQAFTLAQMEALKDAIARGEHPGFNEVPSPEHTITREEAAHMTGISTAKWAELNRRGLIPDGRWGLNPKGSGCGGRRKLYSREEVRRVQDAIKELEEDQRPMVDGVEAITLKAAAEMIGISRPLWYDWERRGWMPEGHMVPKIGGGGTMKVFLPAEIDALKTALANGEHPGGQGRGTPEHTITTRAAAKMLGITVSMWRQWTKDGIVPPGKKPALGSAKKLDSGDRWTRSEVEQVRSRALELGILHPPATSDHTLTREQAAEMVGISAQMWNHWTRKGVIPRGRLAPHGKGSGKGGLRHLYSHEQVRQARAALDEIGFGRECDATAEHTIPHPEAARMLGVEKQALQGWIKKGWVPGGAWKRNEKGPGLSRLFSPAQVEEARDSLVRHGVRCFDRATAEHTITRQQAARIIGVPFSTWTHWEHQRRTPVGAWGPAAKGTGRCKLFTRAELDDFAEDLRKQHEIYPDPERPGCYRVPIRSWKHRMEAIIDAVDLPHVEGKNWNYSERDDRGPTHGVVIESTCSKKPATLKQLITGRRGHKWKIRHRNGDFLDCRRGNLEVVTQEESSYGNRKIETRNGMPTTSKYKGVCWNEERGKWLAQINCGGVHYHLGRFDEETDAADAYDEAAARLFGEFARLNDPGLEDGAARPRTAA